MDLERIVPQRSASPTVPHLAFQCLEGLIQNGDSLRSFLSKKVSVCAVRVFFLCALRALALLLFCRRL